MIIDDTISFFAVYFHNCVMNLGLSKSFSKLYGTKKFKSVVLCQRDERKGYLMTQSVLTQDKSEEPNMRSYYFVDKEALKIGYKTILDKIDSSDKIFYLLRSNPSYDYEDSQKLIYEWKENVKNATQKN